MKPRTLCVAAGTTTCASSGRAFPIASTPASEACDITFTSTTTGTLSRSTPLAIAARLTMATTADAPTTDDIAIATVTEDDRRRGVLPHGIAAGGCMVPRNAT